MYPQMSRRDAADPKISLSVALQRNWQPKNIAEAVFSCASLVGNRSRVGMSWNAIRNSYDELRDAEKNVERAHSNVSQSKIAAKKILQEQARVVLVTLGSAHGVARTLNTAREDGILENSIQETHLDMSATVICDEASTVQTGLFFSAMASFESKISNVIIVGDDRQLEPYWPIVAERGSNEAAVKPMALFDNTWKVAKHNAVNLKGQYRMPRQIMRILNEFFYSDRPLTFEKVEDRSQRSMRSLEWVHVPTTTSQSNRRNQTVPGRRQGGASRDSEKRDETSALEAIEAAYIARSAQEDGKTVLVITPYRQQRDRLKRDLGIVENGRRPRDSAVPDVSSLRDGSISVCTVDGAQGQEADVIVISMVRSWPTRFLNKKRLCVMLSRAKIRMVIVGDHTTHLSCRNDQMRKLAEKCEDADSVSEAKTV